MNKETIGSGIMGLTIDDAGKPMRPVLRVVAKVGIGRPTGYQFKDGRTLRAPEKLDHFVFLNEDTQRVIVKFEGKNVEKVARVWVDDLKLTEHYGENCKEIDIYFDDNDPTVIFKNNLEKWVSSGLACHGDRMRAERIMEHVKGDKDKKKTWQRMDKPIMMNCPCEYFEDGTCKPVGTMYFNAMHSPKLGVVSKFQTTSYNTIKHIYGAIIRIKSATCTTEPRMVFDKEASDAAGSPLQKLVPCNHSDALCNGRIAGIPLKMMVKPTPANPTIKGKKMSVIVYTVHLEFRPNAKDVFGALIAEDERLSGRRQITGKVEVTPEPVVFDDDVERTAADVAGHFDTGEDAKFTENETAPPEDDESDPWTDDQTFIDEINRLMAAVNKNNNTSKMTKMIKDAGGTNITDIPVPARKAFLTGARKLAEQ